MTPRSKPTYIFYGSIPAASVLKSRGSVRRRTDAAGRTVQNKPVFSRLTSSGAAPSMNFGMSTIQGDTVPSNATVLQQAVTKDDLRRLCERKDRFIAVAGHELRNELSPIVASLEVLMQSSRDETQAELLRMASHHARQLSRLIDDLFDASRLASGKVRLCKEPTDVRRIAEHCIQAVTPAIKQRGQQLLVTRSETPLWLSADPLRFEQIFLNLLNNAVQYTPERGCIWFKQQRENDTAVFQVRDSGCGIQPDAIPRIFDFFSRTDYGNGRTPGGLGIGLAVVKSLVEMHNGTIEAHSDGPGCGADFTIRLPLHGK
jgi:signal transduction histidine kinase